MGYISAFDLFQTGPRAGSALSFALTRSARGFARLVRRYLDDREGDDDEYRILLYIYGDFSGGESRQLQLARIRSGLAEIEDRVRFTPESSLHYRRDDLGGEFPRGLEYQLISDSEEHGSRLLLSRRWYAISGALLCNESGELLRHENPEDPEADFPEDIDLPYPYENLAELSAHLEEFGDLLRLAAENETAIHGELRLRRRIEDFHELMLEALIPDPAQNESGASRAAGVVHRLHQLRDSGTHAIYAPGTWSGAIMQTLLCERWFPGGYSRELAEDPAARKKRLADVKQFILCGGALGIALGRGRLHPVNHWGCQGEIGIGAAMAAAGLAAAEGQSLPRIFAAARQALDPFIGLACDSSDRQHPCFRRSAMAAVQIIEGMEIIASSDDPGLFSLDRQIEALEASLRRGQRSAADMRRDYPGGPTSSLSRC
jgi:L-serine deaminase